ncbi:MAG: PEP-utilizing enzyme, partial [Acidimicrobiales bacterium]
RGPAVTGDNHVELLWASPGPGSWVLDQAHKATSVTLPWQDVFPTAMAEGFRSWTARYGLPLSHIEVGYVNGYGYLRPLPAGVHDTGRAGPPPAFVLKILVRLVPELRHRAGAARVARAERIWRADARRWWGETRPARVATNLVVQAVEVGRLDDAELAAHLRLATAELRGGLVEHFDLIGAIALPVGDLVLTAEGWGIGPTESLGLLRGATPASAGLARSLSRVGTLLAAAGTTVTSLDDIAPTSPAGVALEEALRLHRWRLLAGADLDAPTIEEMPNLVAALIDVGKKGITEAGEAQAGIDAIRARAPADERAIFDQLLAEACAGYALRDDNVGVCVQWPAGLLRRGLLEAGHRLVARGAIDAAEHVLDLHVDETVALVAGDPGGGGLDAVTVAARVQARSAADSATPPVQLGARVAPAPDPSAFPPAMAENVRAIDAYRRLADGDVRPGESRGTGVGTRRHRGRAVVVAEAAEALERLVLGDVLVIATTNPCVNPALALAGAVVTEQGGLLCHTAIAARELDLPAVVGLADACRLIPDGATIEVDPASGTVAVLSTSSTGEGPPPS